MGADGEQFCQDQFGSHLASIHNEAQNAEIHSIINGIAWVGSNDISTEGTWVWTDNSDNSYSNWYPGQPDNWRDGDCVNIGYLWTRRWDDDACSLHHPFVCNQPSVGTEKNPPNWPSNVHVFAPGDENNARTVIQQMEANNGGNYPTHVKGEWSEKRYALLFKPGFYNLDIDVGYYTSVIGLGEQPSDTKITNVKATAQGVKWDQGSLVNFWRSAENFQTGGDMEWAVSQGAPLRRVTVNGDLRLSTYYSNAGRDGYASGGFLADSVVTGTIYSGTQQQWFTRNTNIGKEWNGNNWNMVFQGVPNAPAEQCDESERNPDLVTVIADTPVIAEKPFIAFQNGKYYLMIPHVETDKSRQSQYASTKVDFINVYVASEDDSASTINGKIASGLHVVLTGGMYDLSEPIRVTRSNVVILGIGFPTLRSTNGNALIEVEDNLEGVRISGILLEAGKTTSPHLLQFGRTQGIGSGYNFLYDIFARVGGPNNQDVDPQSTDVMMKIQSNQVVMDYVWLWRADHDAKSGGAHNNWNYRVRDGNNAVDVALQVNGDEVYGYAIKAEHTLKNQVEWSGDDGYVAMFQCELPYDLSNDQFSEYTGFKVDNNVNTFEGYGMGIYSIFDHDVFVANAIESPQNKNGVVFENVYTVTLKEKGEITNVVNGKGNAVKASNFDILSPVCHYGGTSP